MKVWNVPIESLEERYSAQWAEWFPREFHNLGVDFTTVEGESLSDKIEVGSFLDVYSTNFYKAKQLCSLIKYIRNGEIKDGDILFINDLWFPGLESLQYIRQGAKKKFKIAGIFHAGTYDSYDFLSRQGMCFWGEPLENSWLSFIDVIFVATEYHKGLLVNNRKVDEKKIYVTGLPIYFDDYPKFKGEKQDIVVFPHRLDLEKCPMTFDSVKEVMASLNNGWQFIKSKEVVNSKKEYFELLSRSKIAVSFALQETWGIAQQEAVIYGNIPLVPDRLSYSEMYSPVFKFSNMRVFYEKLNSFLNPSNYILTEVKILRRSLRDKGKEAISKMVEIMKEVL